jgi:hypothetical protein
MAYKRILKITSLVFLFTILLFLTFNKHSKSNYFNFHSEIWADKAGYNVYLPALFKYNFDPHQFPDSIDSKTGHGFKLDYENKKIQTKYTCGIAILQTPFYLLADILSEPLGYESDGYSPIYFGIINIASVFYFLIALIFFYKFLRNYFSITVTTLTITTIFLGTNLYYYIIDDTGMSHGYSFFLFSAYLFFLKKNNFQYRFTLFNSFLFGLLIGLIVLIRPTNILFILCIFFFELDNLNTIKDRLRNIMRIKYTLFTLISFAIVLLPQLLYWNYLTGSFFHYSYAEEGFSWLKPQIFKTWFATNNGLFSYNPFYLLILLSTILLITQKQRLKIAIPVLVIFLVLSYILSCWYIPSFGCSYGQRSFVEYLPILCLPIGYLYERVLKFPVIKQVLFWGLILVIIVFNLKLIYIYDECFYGDYWDWDIYFNLIKSAIL